MLKKTSGAEAIKLLNFVAYEAVFRFDAARA